MKNLSEFLSPSVQQSVGTGNDDDPGNDDDEAGPGGGGHWNGSYHCPSFKTKGSAMCAAIWWKPPPSTPFTSKEQTTVVHLLL